MPFMLVSAVITFVGDHDAAARARQAELGQAHAQDGVRVPQRRGVAEDDAGERHAVGVVDHQRNITLLRQQVELHQLFVGDHVAGRVGRP